MLVSRPKVSKTIIKGTIVIAIFSLFLKINSHTIFNYLIFLSIAYFSLLLYMFWKRSHIYEITDNEILIKSPLNKKIINYSEIDDEFVSSGFLARRFNCGSIYIISKKRNVNIIRDVENPENIENEIRKHILRQ
jgi:hypothetical protein